MDDASAQSSRTTTTEQASLANQPTDQQRMVNGFGHSLSLSLSPHLSSGSAVAASTAPLIIPQSICRVVRPPSLPPSSVLRRWAELIKRSSKDDSRGASFLPSFLSLSAMQMRSRIHPRCGVLPLLFPVIIAQADALLPPSLPPSRQLFPLPFVRKSL